MAMAHKDQRTIEPLGFADDRRHGVDLGQLAFTLEAKPTQALQCLLHCANRVALFFSGGRKLLLLV
ncbi:hypothetical protein D3C77_664980 [compost metagenome]